VRQRHLLFQPTSMEARRMVSSARCRDMRLHRAEEPEHQRRTALAVPLQQKEPRQAQACSRQVASYPSEAGRQAGRCVCTAGNAAGNKGRQAGGVSELQVWCFQAVSPRCSWRRQRMVAGLRGSEWCSPNWYSDGVCLQVAVPYMLDAKVRVCQRVQYRQ